MTQDVRTSASPGSPLARSVAEQMDQLTRTVVRLDRERGSLKCRVHVELERLNMYQNMGSLVNTTFSLEKIFEAIVNSVVKDLNYENVLIYLNEPSGLELRASTGLEQDEREALGPRLTGYVQQREKAGATDAIVLDLEDDALDEEVRRSMEDFYLVRGVEVPVRRGDELVGAVIAMRRGAQPVSQDELRSFSMLAAQMAIAIINSRMFARLEDYSRDLERQVEERTHELRETSEQLAQSEKMAFLGQLTAGIAHEMNTPIGAVANSLKSLMDLAEELRQSFDAPEVTKEDYKEIVSEMKNSLSIADSALTKAAGFVRSLKTQTRDLANVQVREFNPADTVRDIGVLLAHELRRTNCTLVTDEVDQGLLLEGDAGKYSQIITNLVNNAMDAYDGRQPGPIIVRLRGDGKDIVLQIADKGCGIKKENQKRLFKEIFTTKWQGKGTGLGLSIVHGIVTGNFKGTITFESEENVGTTFTVRLPRKMSE
ncbi:MAG: sensor histidine kinase [Candidatus Xenobia bacterium]